MYSKWIVALVIILNSGFALGVLAVFWHTAAEPAVLVGSWFAFTTGELWMMASIRKAKLKKGEQDTNEIETKMEKP